MTVSFSNRNKQRLKKSLGIFIWIRDGAVPSSVASFADYEISDQIRNTRRLLIEVLILMLRDLLLYV